MQGGNEVTHRRTLCTCRLKSSWSDLNRIRYTNRQRTPCRKHKFHCLVYRLIPVWWTRNDKRAIDMMMIQAQHLMLTRVHARVQHMFAYEKCVQVAGHCKRLLTFLLSAINKTIKFCWTGKSWRVRCHNVYLEFTNSTLMGLLELGKNRKVKCELFKKDTS